MGTSKMSCKKIHDPENPMTKYLYPIRGWRLAKILRAKEAEKFWQKYIGGAWSMSINLTDKLDEAIVEIEKIIRDKEKATKSKGLVGKVQTHPGGPNY